VSLKQLLLMVRLSNRENPGNTGLRRAWPERENVNIFMKRTTRDTDFLPIAVMEKPPLKAAFPFNIRPVV
ncbi:MAG: hypothetical protein WA140_04705, partial [Geobacteraceae bacterium]